MFNGRVLRFFGETLRQAGILILGSAIVIWGLAFIIGLQCGIEGAYLNRSIGAPAYSGVFSAWCDLRELMPYAFGYMMSAKVGTGLVAEIGAMRISDEIDALEVMGINSLVFLCATRLLAAWLVLPFVYIAAVGAGFFASYLAVVQQIGEVSSGGYFLIFWMFQNPPDLFYSPDQGDGDGHGDRAGRVLLRLHGQRRPGRGGHRDREVDGAEHGDGAPRRDGGNADLLGHEPKSSDRRIGRTRWREQRRERTGPTARPARLGGHARGAAAGRDAAFRRRRRRSTQEDVPDNIKAQTREGEDPYQWHSGRTREHGAQDAVEFIDVHKAFGRNTILNGLNLGLPDGQISMILGPSGHRQVGVHQAHGRPALPRPRATCWCTASRCPSMADDELFEMRKKFGVLFQDGALFGSMNVFDNTAFPLRQHTDKGEDEISEIVLRRLGEVGLGGALDKMPNELSGGMRKRAGFARALVLDPDIVLFDEPDSGLDPVRTALLCELIMEVHEENGGAYCVITHDIMSARRVADYIAILWKGRIVESGPASELFNSDNQFVRQFLSGEAQGPLGME